MYSFSCLVVVGLFLCCILPLYYGNFKHTPTEREWYKELPSPVTSVNTWPILFHLYSHPARGYFEQISTIIHKYFRMPPRKIITLLLKCNNPNITCIPWYYHKSSVQNSSVSPTFSTRMTTHFWIAQGKKCIRGEVSGASRESLAAVNFFSRSLLKLPKSAGGALQDGAPGRKRDESYMAPKPGDPERAQVLRATVCKVLTSCFFSNLVSTSFTV